MECLVLSFYRRSCQQGQRKGWKSQCWDTDCNRQAGSGKTRIWKAATKRIANRVASTAREGS